MFNNRKPNQVKTWLAFFSTTGFPFHGACCFYRLLTFVILAHFQYLLSVSAPLLIIAKNKLSKQDSATIFQPAALCKYIRITTVGKRNRKLVCCCHYQTHIVDSSSFGRIYVHQQHATLQAATCNVQRAACNALATTTERKFCQVARRLC